MSDLRTFAIFRTRYFAIAVSLTLFIVVVNAVMSGMGMEQYFATMGNDDIMRLLFVRDFVNGQGWYDLTQYRLLPPEGVEFHWSRYIDAGIAAIILPLSTLFPMNVAEQVAATIWPTFIMITHILVVAFGTKRIFGAPAACFALLCLVLWPVSYPLHGSAGNLDHHNVQMLMMTTLAFAVIWQTNPTIAGIVGGITAGFSLAIGLESLVIIVGGGFVLFLRAVVEGTPTVRRHLVVFCATLFLASIVFWLGQTPPDIRMMPVCDRLATPTLSLISVAAVASVLPLAFGRRFSGPVAHLATTVIVTAIGIALAWPLLGSCLDGPYGLLPIQLQEFISNRIVEAKPFVEYAKSRPRQALVFVLPVFAAVGVGFVQWVSARKAAGAGPQNAALGQLLILGFIGLVMVFMQMRTVILAASIVPVIGGVVVARMLTLYLKERSLMVGVAGLFIAMLIISSRTVSLVAGGFLPQPVLSAPLSENECRSYDSLIVLNEIPPAVLLSHVNYGPSVLWATHHSTVSAGFHLSAEAFGNSVLTFRMGEAEMEPHLKASGADYLLLCRDHKYDGSFATGIAAGAAVDWLRPVPLSNDEQLLLEILR